MINNLEDVILLLSDEELLKDNAISREEFTLDNLLRMLDIFQRKNKKYEAI